MAWTVGITVRTTTARPHLRGVALNEATDEARTFQHKSSTGTAVEDQLHALGQAFLTELTAQPVDAVWIREAGYARGSGLTAPTKTRLRAEGVCLAAARTVTQNVRIGDVNAATTALGNTKTAAQLDADGAALTNADCAEAAGAALAARAM